LEGIVHQPTRLFSFLNVVLLLGLIAVYGNSFRKIRARFTVGLLFFFAIFLVQNLLAFYSYITMFMYYADEVAGLVLGITFTQTVGLSILLRLSLD
jgi:hypothetical protein